MPWRVKPHGRVCARALGLHLCNKVTGFCLRRSHGFLESKAMILVHSGQSGVERGAHRAAVTFGWVVEGYCSSLSRDELGPLPDDIAGVLTPHADPGPRVAAHANVAISSVVIVLVPDVAKLTACTGMPAIRRVAVANGVPFLATDPNTPLEDIHRWLSSLTQDAESLRIMVTGPRRTRWQEGERAGWRVVSGLTSLVRPAAEEFIPASLPSESRSP